MKIVELEKSCFACPSQWEGILSNGDAIYIRYRWGKLGVGVGKTIEDAIDNRLVSIQVGHSFDGYMSTKQMLKLLRKKDIKTSLKVYLKSLIPKVTVEFR